MTWSKPPTGFIPVVESEVSKTQRAVALQALTGVVERSPVDEGRFRSNNILSVGRPFTQQTNDDTNTAPQGSRVGQGYTEGVKRLADIKTPYTIIFIQNNLPYSERLEAGYSGQAPTGVYSVTFDAIRAGLGQ